MFAWPPPDHATGCVRGVRDGETTPVLLLFHYVDERGSQWGFTTKTYRSHGYQEVDHDPFDGWVWDGPSVPSVEDQGFMVVVWEWQDAPGELRAYSNHGGDEDLVALVPADRDPSFLDRLHWSGNPTEETLPDGRRVMVWAHA